VKPGSEKGETDYLLPHVCLSFPAIYSHKKEKSAMKVIKIPCFADKRRL
jgi:hypothetical protein